MSRRSDPRTAHIRLPTSDARSPWRVVPNWYHSPVALNIRLTEAEETALTELATAEGISKNDVVRRAILDRHARTIRRRDVDEATNWAREHYRSLLDRLAQ